MKRKQIISIILCISALLALFAPGASASSADVLIRSSDAFLAFAQNCTLDTYSQGRIFSLECDVDLSGKNFTGVPYFAGVFLGNGHLITGLSITSDGSRLGLFRQIADGGEVRNLRVEGTVTPGGTGCLIGGICGENSGSIAGCTFSGKVAGIENVGGIAGSNTASGGITSCKFSGSLTGEHAVGGIAGLNAGGVNACTNRAKVNTVPIVTKSEPGFDLSQFGESEFLDITDVGGICGNNSGIVTGCTNAGDTGYLYSGYNIGGICGKSSGYITGCTSNAEINGRRDVGGVCGQLIPYSEWDFSEGKLDELKNSIGGLAAAINNTSAAVSGSIAGISGELYKMNVYTDQALIELEKLIENAKKDSSIDWEHISIDPETGKIDLSSLNINIGDTTALTAALANMYAESTILTQAAGYAAGSAMAGLSSVFGQMNAVFATMFDAVENIVGMGIEKEDLSVAEAMTREIGAIDKCSSYGKIKAENNLGGIAGTVSFEVEFDMEDTLNASSVISSKAKHYTFAALRGCTAHVTGSVKENCCGTIAGNMDLGIIIDSTGIGSISSQSGDYLGGIVGKSAGTVSRCWSRAAINGGKYIGGIAGSGNNITECRSCSIVEAGNEYIGSIAGWADGEILANLYAESSVGGIDGVSYAGRTDPVMYSKMVSLETVPSIFTDITVTFLVDGKPFAEKKVEFGKGIDQLPEVPNDGIKYWKWDEFDSAHIYYSMEIGGQYILPLSTLSSGEKIPAILVEGTFYGGQELTSVPYVPSQEYADDIITAQTLHVNDCSDPLTVRVRTPDDGKLYTAGPEGVLAESEYERDGSYIVFRLDNGGSYVLVADHTISKRTITFTLLAALFILILSTAIITTAERKKKKSKRN